MLACVDPAEARLLRNGREAVEGADDPGKYFRGDAQLKRLVAEHGAQHERAAGTDRGVCAGVSWIGGGFTCLRKPIWIRRRVGVAVRGGGSIWGYPPAGGLRGIGVVKCDPFICKGEIEQREHTGALRGRQVMRMNRRLSDLVPVVLNRSVPEPADERLVCRSGGTVGDAQRLHFVEDGGVLGAGQCRRRPKAELLGALEGERSDSRPMRELRLRREIGRCGLVVSGGVTKDKRNRCCG